MSPGLIIVAAVATVYTIFTLTRWEGRPSIPKQTALWAALSFLLWFGITYAGIAIPWWVAPIVVGMLWAAIVIIVRRH